MPLMIICAEVLTHLLFPSHDHERNIPTVLALGLLIYALVAEYQEQHEKYCLKEAEDE